jgi:hypothetical protein
VTGDELPEVADLEAAAEWRLRQVDADPSDTASAAAARRLQDLAEDLRRAGDGPLLRELHAICNWLAESDNISAFVLRAEAYRRRIGIDAHPADGAAYLQALLGLAREAM